MEPSCEPDQAPLVTGVDGKHGDGSVSKRGVERADNVGPRLGTRHTGQRTQGGKVRHPTRNDSALVGGHWPKRDPFTNHAYDCAFWIHILPHCATSSLHLRDTRRSRAASRLRRAGAVPRPLGYWDSALDSARYHCANAAGLERKLLG